MEFLEGETLAERLRRGALPVNEIFKIGISIAEALAIAHRQGIVHRALKPGNLMLTQAGAKLIDFGLAKPLAVANSGPTSASAPSFTAAPTMSGASPLTPLTTAGTVIGTTQYMSPEQIEGKEADARSDIFAFGAVLYEMTTGKRPFQGKSEISLAFRNSPKPSRTDQRDQTANFAVIRPRRRDLPAEKIPKSVTRLRTISSSNSNGLPPRSQQSQLPRSRPSRCKSGRAWAGSQPSSLPSSSASSPDSFCTARLLGHRFAPPSTLPSRRMSTSQAIPLDLPSFRSIVPGSRSPLPASMARPLSGCAPSTPSMPASSPGTDDSIFPFWSFDGRSIAFFAEGKLKTVDLSGGSPQILAEASFGRGGAWGADGVIVYSPTTLGPLYRVSANGGAAVPR
jgi:eukaryotic-like serine/threonine-protein kinase